MGRAYAFNSGGEPHYFTEPERIEESLLSVCDYYNTQLKVIAECEGGLLEAENLLKMIELGASLHNKFVAVHPFSDGNGRMARILVANLFCSVTPFLITPSAEGGSEDTRKMARGIYLDAVRESQDSDRECYNVVKMTNLLVHTISLACQECLGFIKEKEAEEDRREGP